MTMKAGVRPGRQAMTGDAGTVVVDLAIGLFEHGSLHIVSRLWFN
jgi:hypothetical protein